MKNPTADRVRALFDYDPLTGIFLWRWRPRYDFRREQNWLTWNAKYPGRVAGYLSPDGYRYLRIDGTRHGEHRIAWLYFHGVLPDQTDHQDGIRTNNRIANLRDVTIAENAKNQVLRSTNKSGVTGVCWDRSERRWAAYIYQGGRQKRLGYFNDMQSAAKARKEAEIELGFHPNHGRAA